MVPGAVRVDLHDAEPDGRDVTAQHVDDSLDEPLRPREPAVGHVFDERDRTVGVDRLADPPLCLDQDVVHREPDGFREAVEHGLELVGIKQRELQQGPLLLHHNRSVAAPLEKAGKPGGKTALAALFHLSPPADCQLLDISVTAATSLRVRRGDSRCR
jgi:hypothetical protein